MDRAISRILYDTKNKEEILMPSEYILSRQGKVLVYGQDIDFKSGFKKLVKSAKSFKISEAKKLIINTDNLEVTANNYHSYIP